MTEIEHQERALSSRCSMMTGIAMLLAIVFGAAALAQARDSTSEKSEEYGISVNRPVLAAACKICPWGALADLVAQAMKPYGYDVQVCYNCSRLQAPQLVASAGKPEPVKEEWARAVPAIAPDQLPIQIPPRPMLP